MGIENSFKLTSDNLTFRRTSATSSGEGAWKKTMSPCHGPVLIFLFSFSITRKLLYLVSYLTDLFKVDKYLNLCDYK